MKIAIKGRQRSNSAVRFEGKKTFGESSRASKVESLRLHFIQQSCVFGAPPDMGCVLHTRTDKAFVYS